MEKISREVREEVHDSDHVARHLSAVDGTEQENSRAELQNTTQNAGKMINSFLSAQDLRDCDWEQLQVMFSAAMEEHARVERDLQEQTKQLLKVLRFLRRPVSPQSSI